MHVVATARAHLHESVPSFVSRVEDIVCKSKLWSDLDLAVLLRSCDRFSGVDNSTTIKLSFGLRRKAGRPSTHRIWRVPISAQHDGDAAPPANIHTAYLSTIKVFLEVYDSNQARQEFFPLAPTLPISIPPETSIVKFKQWSTIKSLQGFPELPLTQTGCLNESMDNSALLFLEELENMGDDHRLEEDRNSQMHREVDQLLRKGLRSLIVERRRRSDTETRSSGDRDLQPLSRLVPSVFSLGYREAMNQRSHLIPSIAKSLASVLKTTRNPTLQSRINDLQALHNPRTEVVSQATGSTDFRAALQTALWKIAQKQLYDPGASRKLSVSDAVTTSAENYGGAEEDLLSEVGMDDFHGDLNSESHEIYDSDCYLGSDSEDPEFIEEDETNSVLSFDGNYSHHSTDMLGHGDTELDRIWEDRPILGHTQNRTAISVLDLSEQLSCQLSISDGEMLASDCFEDEPKSPQILPYSPSFPGTPEASDKDCDLMLCDHN
ncbi:hypothetical protein CNMCM5793_008296 [Aspergillus hiratsukae]|uniref:Uncharacterized protein n=1 Tax=Aspergillus hiratsukae TaxID=1194566 RepID=A0A8H6P080_9EURO|nr:hypothetical protein CNMCM5793_008296 [Aspergillus hiratsukae]KAF7156147.1 hypothetical protein CNMCM6106_008873 [Aspergillus hiratsukae]